MSARTYPPAHNRPRDQEATGFSRHLDALLVQVPEALCAVFVDGEGEAVDLATKIDPFDAKIAGAEVAIVLAGARSRSAASGRGEVLEIRLECPERSVIARFVSGGYDLVVLVQSDAISGRAAEATAQAAIELMIEAGLRPPPSYAVLRAVERRPSKSGILVPSSFEEGGVRRRVVSVLGHCEDLEALKYLVRLDNGEELVLAHEPATGGWRRSI